MLLAGEHRGVADGSGDGVDGGGDREGDGSVCGRSKLYLFVAIFCGFCTG